MWVKQLPSREGYYWYRKTPESIVEVVRSCGSHFYVTEWHDAIWPGDEPREEFWSVPIPPPPA